MRKRLCFGLFMGMVLICGGCGNHSSMYRECVPEPELEPLTRTYIHKYGIPVPQEEWKTRGEDGKIVSTLKTGVVVTKNYKKGYLEGETTYTFPHSGAIHRIETYSEGRLLSELENYPSGLTRRQVEYLSPLEERISIWYENGTPSSREEYRDGKLMEGDYYTLYRQVESRVDDGQGKRINRDEFGQLLSVDRIENGLLAQRMILYPNGSPKEIIPYINGKIAGRRQTFLPGGEPLTVEEWDAGRQQGLTFLFQNGEKVAEVPYFNGQKNGVEERFRDGYFRVEEISWKNGKKHGPCYRYIGDEILVEWYCEGKPSTKAEYDLVENLQFR